MTERDQQTLADRFVRGHAVYPLIAIIASGLVAIPTVNWAYRASHGDRTTTIGLLAIVGLLIAGIGCVLRAVAHNRMEIIWVDHLGKLLAVAAFAYAFWDDALVVGQDVWGDIAAALTLWLGAGLLTLVSIRVSYLLLVRRNARIAAEQRERAAADLPGDPVDHDRAA